MINRLLLSPSVFGTIYLIVRQQVFFFLNLEMIKLLLPFVVDSAILQRLFLLSKYLGNFFQKFICLI